MSVRFIVEEHGPVVRLRMGRRLAGRVRFEVSAWLLGDLLIDTGPPPAAERLLAWLGDRPLGRVVLTHHHEDHSGGAAALAARGVEILAPAAAREMLAEGLRIPPYRRWFWGGRPGRVSTRPLGERLEHGGWSFRVVPTPGHAIDHVCLLDEDAGLLVAGDLFVHPRVRYLRRAEDAQVHLDSLRRVLALVKRTGVCRMLCGHAGVVEEPAAALQEKIDFWERLRERAEGLVAAGYPVGEVARRLLGPEDLLAWLSLGDFSKRNLVRSLLGRRRRPGS